MKITVAKVKRELEKKHGWENLNYEPHKWLIDTLIKDTIDIIKELRNEKL